MDCFAHKDVVLDNDERDIHIRNDRLPKLDCESNIQDVGL